MHAGTLTAAEHSLVGEKLLGFIIQSGVVSVYAAELSDSGGSTVFQLLYSSACQVQTWWE